MSGTWTADRTCPFCGSDDEFFSGQDQTVQQYSHNSTIHREEICDECGYVFSQKSRGNARRTSLQTWRPEQAREKMPEKYCLLVCTECNEHNGAVKIGHRVEVEPHTELSQCCSAFLKVAYTFDDIAGKKSIDKPNYRKVAARQIYPHIIEYVDAKIANPDDLFIHEESETELRIKNNTVEVRQGDSSLGIEVEDGSTIVQKLWRNPGLIKRFE